MLFNRDNIVPMINGVSGAHFRGFSTHEAALEHYLNVKGNGRVKIVRNPGDEEQFGPLDKAIQ
jgi:hypothetical protein